MEIAEILNDSFTAYYEEKVLPPLFEDLRNRVAFLSYRIASYLTDPVSKAHEYFRRLYLVDHLHQASSPMVKLVKKITLIAGLAGCASIGFFTTLPGISLRCFASQIQTRPYVSVVNQTKNKGLTQDRSFSLLSWNICCTNGGYAISDGGVMPEAFRIDRVLEKIIEKDADVNCLYEVFDVNTGWYIQDKLQKQGYTHFYFSFGSRGVGVASGIFVASKYRIVNPEFTPFSQDMLVGRTKNCAKGVFAFDLESHGKLFAKIFTTHLQNSEEPAFPNAEEVEARRKEMQLIVDKVNAVRDRCVLVTGDLNLDDEEYASSSWKDLFEKRDHFTMKTWGGDGFCSEMVGRRISKPLNLDHTMAVRGSVRGLHTTLVETGFEGAVFKEEALSDHAGLFSRVTVD